MEPVEKLSVVDLLPTVYEPKRSYQWILAVDDIDSFIVKRLELPKWTAVEGKPVLLTPMLVEFYDPIVPSGAQQVMAACMKSSVTPLELSVKLLDSVGTVVQLWKLSGATVLEVDFGNLDYADRDPIVIKATFNIKHMALVY